MAKLQYPYLTVETQNGTSYGGSQTWFPYHFLKKSGCGVISAADVILHMQKKGQMSEEEYIEFSRQLWLKYLPVIPGFGMNGLMLMIGLNRYFHTHGMKYCACWKIGGRKMFSRIDRMLENEIPVILAVGPNFPMFWKRKKLTFYTKNAEIYVPAAKTCGHFVTVTGREGLWLSISSWGKKYYIDIREYRDYVKLHSNSLISNIIEIKKL